MVQRTLKCPNCQNEIIRDYDGKQKLRTNILVFENSKCLAKCLKCRSNIEVPVTLNLSPQSEHVKKRLRHVIFDVDRH